MASGNIKGIFIEIGGETTGLQNALKEVDKSAKATQDELKDVEKALKMDPGNTTLIAQQQELLQDAIHNTTNRLDVLRTAQQQVEQQFASGQIDATQYRAFQRELNNSEAALRQLETRLASSDENLGRFTDAQQQLQTYLRATNQSVEDLSGTLGTRLTNAIRNGSANADQLEMALRRISTASGNSTQDLERFRDTLRRADDNNLDQVRRDLEEISGAAEEAEKDVNGLGAALGGIAAGVGIGGTIAAALDLSNLETKIEMTMDLDEKSAEAVRQSIKRVSAALEDEESALEGVRRQFTLNADASVEENQRIIDGATAIAYAYSDIDFKELIQESHEVGKELGISQQEALEMVDALLKVGFPPDQLDIISEYGNQLKMAGFNALEIQAIMASGVDTGTWNIDNLLDKFTCPV